MLWVSRRAVRTDRTRAAALLWGGWLLCTGLVFSYMSGIIHPYYMVALAPAIAALVSVGAMALWERRLGWFGRLVATATVGVTVWWACELLSRSASWLPWLRWVIILAGVAAAASILAGPRLAAMSGSRLDGPEGSPAARRRLGLAAVPVVLRAGGGAHRAGGVRHRHGGDHAHRVDPERRTADDGGLRWPRRDRRRRDRRRDRWPRDRDRAGGTGTGTGRPAGGPPGQTGGSAGTGTGTGGFPGGSAGRARRRRRDGAGTAPGGTAAGGTAAGGTGDPAGSAGTPR